MSIKVSLGAAVGLMAITAAVTFIITSNVTLDRFNQKIKSVSEKQEFYSKLSEIDTYSRTHYISEIDESKLIEGMVSGYISGIGDSYAEYLTAEQYAQELNEESGVSVGLGFNYEKENGGYIKITEVVPASSADDAGLMAGDIITAVNNTDVIAFAGGYDEAISLFTCEEGTRVKLYIKRTEEDGSTDFITYDVTAQRTEKVTVTGRLLTPTQGYIRIASFTDKTEAQLKAKLDELISAGAEGLIFDLRNNEGGTMSMLQSCLDHIIGAGDIVTAQYISGSTEPVVVCTEAEKLNMPMSVIVNRNTAGTAELFAFALADNCGAHTIGKNTAGKGYSQSVYTCSDGSVVKLSTAIVTTANSGNFNGVGLKPEFDVSIPADMDITQLSDEAAVLTDTQLIKAMEVTIPQPEAAVPDETASDENAAEETASSEGAAETAAE